MVGQAAPQRFFVRENGLEFELSFQEGYSSGLFLDQRENRRRLLAGYVGADFDSFADGRTGWGPVGIAGGAPGVNAELEMNPLTRDVIVVMSNRSPPSAARIAQQLEGEVRKWKDGA